MGLKIWSLQEVNETDNVILVDVDGTAAAEVETPTSDVGGPQNDVVNIMGQLQEHGYNIVLWTGRTNSNFSSDPRQAIYAVETWVEQFEIPCDGLLLYDKPLARALVDNKCYHNHDTQTLLRDLLAESVDQESGISGWLEQSDE